MKVREGRRRFSRLASRRQGCANGVAEEDAQGAIQSRLPFETRRYDLRPRVRQGRAQGKAGAVTPYPRWYLEARIRPSAMPEGRIADADRIASLDAFDRRRAASLGPNWWWLAVARRSSERLRTEAQSHQKRERSRGAQPSCASMSSHDAARSGHQRRGGRAGHRP